MLAGGKEQTLNCLATFGERNTCHGAKDRTSLEMVLDSLHGVDRLGVEVAICIH